MNVKMELLKRGCEYKSEAIKKAFDDAYEQIITIVKECGGVLKTPASSDKSTLYAFYESAGRGSDWEAVAIQGLRWDDELGLCICTNDMLDNYQYDTGYEFEYYFDFEGEDLENLNKALDDPAYYVEFDKYGLVYTDTIMSIIGGIADYIE